MVATSHEVDSPDPLGPDVLPGAAKSVLAVLLLASVWQDRFVGGWVTVEQFGRFGVRLGLRPNRESLKATIIRGLREITSLADPPSVDTRPSSDPSTREIERRLCEPIPVAVQNWLLQSGGTYLQPEIYQEFLATHYKPTLSFQEIVAGLEDTVVRSLLAQGRYDDAIVRVRAAIRNADTDRDRRPLELTFATALIRRARDGDWEDAEQILRRLETTPATPVDLADRISEARVNLTSAYCAFLLYVRGVRPRTDVAYDTVDRIRGLLDEAAALTADLSLSDRAQITNLRGLLLQWEAHVEPEFAAQALLYDQAESHLRQALTLWRAAHDNYALGVSLYNMGSLMYSRYRLSKGNASQRQIREALKWYEASVAYTEGLGVLSEWVLDYLKAAECIALLVPHVAVSGDTAEGHSLLQKAEDYLTMARRTSPARQWHDIHGRVETLLQRTRRDYLDPAAPSE